MSFLETVRERWCIPLGSIAGVPILAHFTFWAVLFLFSSSGIGGWLLVLGVCSLLAHEFGHVLTAKRMGIQTKEVVLLPIGAAAIVTDMPLGGRKEFVIALAGPIVSLLLAAVFFGLSYVFPAPEIALAYPDWNSPQELFYYLGVFNAAMGLFNLVPALPLDGGRVLRASLSKWKGPLGATRIASIVSLVLSAVGGALFLFSGAIIPFLICVFVFISSQAEYFSLKEQEEQQMKRKLIDAFEKMMEEGDLTAEETGEESKEFIAFLKRGLDGPTKKKPTTNIGKLLTVLFAAAIFWAYLSDIVFMGVLGAGGKMWMAVVACAVFIYLGLSVTMKILRPLYKDNDDEPT